MAEGHVNRTVLSSYYQDSGDVYDDVQTEGAFEVLAQQIDDNYDAYDAHKTAAVLDHPDGSVTTEKIKNGAVTAAKLAADAQINESVNNVLIQQLQASKVSKSGDTMTGDLILNNSGSTSPAIRFNSTTRNAYIDNINGMFRIVDANALQQRFGINVETGDITLLSARSCTIKAGIGSPEGVVTAPVGSLFLRVDLSGVPCLYSKQSGTGNTGWKAVQTL
jgi:hypothetical protein